MAPQHDPAPEHILLLRGILSTGEAQARAILDIVEAMGRGFANVSRHVTESGAKLLAAIAEHEAAAAVRHAQIMPAIEAHRRDIEAREKAVSEKRAEAVADQEEATATAWKVAKVVGYIVLPIALGLASHYAPDVAAEPAVEVP